MQNIKKTRRECLNERGIGLFIVAASLVVLLGVGGMAVAKHGSTFSLPIHGERF